MNLIKPGYQGIVFLLRNDTIIADVGYGNDPIRGATYYIDKDTDYSPDRLGRRLSSVKEGTVILADISKEIPLPDKCCDFVVCSHCLEHVDDPVKACAELSRIGREGYIETPGLVQELIQNRTDCHKWYVTKWRNVLYFIPHAKLEYRIPLVFPVLLILYLFRHTCLHWTGEIRCKVL